MILMYHHIAPPEVVPKDHVPLDGWNFTHSPEGFERQLVELQQRGYRFVSLGGLVGNLKENGIEPTKTVALTFDDGWLDNLFYAFPILKRLSIPATFFCTTGHIQNDLNESKKMNLAQLQE